MPRSSRPPDFRRVHSRSGAVEPAAKTFYSTIPCAARDVELRSLFAASLFDPSTRAVCCLPTCTMLSADLLMWRSGFGEAVMKQTAGSRRRRLVNASDGVCCSAFYLSRMSAVAASHPNPGGGLPVPRLAQAPSEWAACGQQAAQPWCDKLWILCVEPNTPPMLPR